MGCLTPEPANGCFRLLPLGRGSPAVEGTVKTSDRSKVGRPSAVAVKRRPGPVSLNRARPQPTRVATSAPRGLHEEAGEADAEELYRLAGKVVCVEQEVENKVEMCASRVRDREAREASRLIPGDSGAQAARGDATLLPERGGHEPGADAGIKEKVKLLRRDWEDMESRNRHGISYDQFAGHVVESHRNRCVVAHSTIVRNGEALTNVQKDRDIGVADLERFLARVHLALDAINLLCGHMGLDDYPGYVRQRRGERRTGRRRGRARQARRRRAARPGSVTAAPAGAG